MMTGLTFAQKVLSKHAGRSVKPGDIVFADVDLMMATDGTLPIAAKQFEKFGGRVAHPERVVLVQDHYVPAKDIVSANASRVTREFARKHGIAHHFEVGRGGICHHVLPDAGLTFPGDLIIGADSHTCTYGAFGAFGTGVGSTDFAYALATGKLWFRVPQTIKVVLHGRKGRYVQGKDIALALLARLTIDGATYESIEFTGEGVADLSISDRITICNMGIEAGAKAASFPVDDVTRDFLSKFGHRPIEAVHSDPDAHYAQVVELDISALKCLVARPSTPDNVCEVSALSSQPVKVDQVFIGSCTNGRIEDMRQAAEILSRGDVHPDVRLIVTPGTQDIFTQMAANGLLEVFSRAGAAITPATCGACVGGHMGILGDGEVCLSTSNRNFVGRMGSSSASVYLCNPYVAAASALKGYICSPDEL